jgi:hypothetical protein
MTPDEVAERIGPPVNDLGGRFMLDGATYVRGAELGFDGLAFYFCGRGGVLGPVDADTVIDEFCFFGADAVRTGWDAGLGVMDPADAAAEFMACGHRWGRDHLPATVPGSDLARLARTVFDAAEGLPLLVRAWADAPWPEDEPAMALHAVHLLRELRGGLHAVAVRAQGLDPHAAVMARGGAGVAAFLGWPEPHPDRDAARPAWTEAEVATNAAVAHHLGALDAAQRTKLAELIDGLADAVR